MGLSKDAHAMAPGEHLGPLGAFLNFILLINGLIIQN
jgi:hypothetical protein